MSINALDLLNRFCSLEIEACASAGVRANAVPRWFYVQDEFPYWINRIASITEEVGLSQMGEEIHTYSYEVASRFYLKAATAGYPGENDEQIADQIPTIIEFIAARQWLQTNQYSTPMYNVRAGLTVLVRATGFMLFQAGGTGDQLAGFEMSHQVYFDQTIEQAIL